MIQSPRTTVRFDLFSLNIQRGRDHGICSVNEARAQLKMDRKYYFN